MVELAASLDDLADEEPRTIAASVAGAVLLGIYASWMFADLLPRWLVFGVTLLAGGYGLLAFDARSERLRAGLYAFAALLLSTPVVLVLPDALYADEFGVSAVSLVFTTVNVLLLVVFAVLAAIVGGVGYWLGGTE